MGVHLAVISIAGTGGASALPKGGDEARAVRVRVEGLCKAGSERQLLRQRAHVKALWHGQALQPRIASIHVSVCRALQLMQSTSLGQNHINLHRSHAETPGQHQCLCACWWESAHTCQ
jgi:hypothetical protein